MEWPSHIFIFVFLFPFALSQHCEKDRCDDGESGELKKCKYFDPTQFNEDSPSIVYGKITYTVHFVHACDIYTAPATTKTILIHFTDFYTTELKHRDILRGKKYNLLKH